MTAIEQAKQWLESGYLDTLPEKIEYEYNDGTTDLVFVALKPKEGIKLNLEYLKKRLGAEEERKTMENITEIILSIKRWLKLTGKV